MPTKKKKKYPLDEINDGNKEILFDLLSSKGVATVTVTFDGGGDSGQIEEVVFLSAESDEISKVGISDIVVRGAKVDAGRVWSEDGFKQSYKSDPTVEELIESFCYSALETLYGGWENNDGAFGEFLFRVNDRTVCFDFNERYTESRLYEHEL
jgi:hypothetical protein